VPLLGGSGRRGPALFRARGAQRLASLFSSQRARSETFHLWPNGPGRRRAAVEPRRPIVTQIRDLQERAAPPTMVLARPGSPIHREYVFKGAPANGGPHRVLRATVVGKERRCRDNASTGPTIRPDNNRRWAPTGLFFELVNAAWKQGGGSHTMAGLRLSITEEGRA